MTKRLEVKRKCCKSSPRCKRCPVTLKRLRKAGLATHLDGRNYELDPDVTKKQLRAARHGRL